MSKGLGKGLGALIAMFDEETENIKTSQSERPSSTPIDNSSKQIVPRGTISSDTLEVDINLLDNNINQPRKHFDATGLQELADSIASNGIFQPILATRIGSRYLIVAGERRWRAAKLAGLKTVPVLIRDYTSRQVAEIAIVENLQREDLNAIELAKGIKKLMDDYLLTQEKVATVLGKNRSSIANTLRLLTLPTTVQLMIEGGELTEGHGKCLVSIVDTTRCTALANQTLREGLSVRQLEELIRSGAKPINRIEKPAPRQNLELRHLEKELTQSLGTRVTIQGNLKRGSIKIEYFSESDIEKIVSILKQ